MFYAAIHSVQALLVSTCSYTPKSNEEGAPLFVLPITLAALYCYYSALLHVGNATFARLFVVNNVLPIVIGRMTSLSMEKSVWICGSYLPPLFLKMIFDKNPMLSILWSIVRILALSIQEAGQYWPRIVIIAAVNCITDVLHSNALTGVVSDTLYSAVIAQYYYSIYYSVVCAILYFIN